MNNVSKFAFDEEATAVDKARWLEAVTLINNNGRGFIRNWLDSQVNDEYRDDMKRRLNHIKNNKQVSK